MRPKKRKRFRHIFLTHLGRVKWRLLWAVLCTVGIAATDLLKPWPLKIILDHGILDKPLPQALGFLQGLAEGGKVALVVAAAVAIVFIAVCDGLFSYFQIFITSSVGYKLVYSLRRELFAHLQRLSLSFHNRAKSGDLLNRIASDTNTLKDVFSEDLLKFAAHFLTVIGMFAIMYAINWKISLIVLATLPFLGYSLFYVYRRTKASAKRQRKQEGQVASRMNEVLSAVPLVQAFGREKYEEERFDHVTSQTLQESIRIARLEAAATRSSQIITALGMAGAVLFGALEVLQHRMLPGELILVTAYLSSMYKPIRGLAKLSTGFSKATASADRLSEVLDIEPEILDLPEAIEAADVKGEIVFKDVSFDYGDGKEVLRQISFSVSPGQRLALVGASGAGKSTIVSLLLRLYEAQEGSISVDGVNIKQYQRESLRRQIGIVLQQSILFGATIRENIAYGKPDASTEEIVAAARAANAEEFIRELEDGYDAVIGERGATLSGGQRQRIAIARALIRNAPILILDEPMTGLDVESEAKVREALDRLMAGRTCLMITHDLQAVANADLVLVLEEGRIIERGRHADLVANSGRYCQLYELNLQPPTANAPSDGEPTRPNRPSAECRGAFPVDPDFPQLKVATDPALMLEVFRAHLKPVTGKAYHIQECIPLRFRCRQSTGRCVLQYTLRLVELDTSRQWSQWVSVVIYAQDGKAERLWRQMQAANPRQGIPADSLTYEPVDFIPQLQMLVQVFPFDRKLPCLRQVMGGALRGLEPRLLAQLGPGQWQVEQRRIEPTRYRAEIGAAFKYTVQARETRTARSETRRCYLKVYRNGNGEENFQRLRSLAERVRTDQRLYSVVCPLAYLSELQTLVLEEAAGTSLHQLLLTGSDPVAVVRAVARATAAFNLSELGITRQHSLAEQFQNLKQSLSLVEWASPQSRVEARAIADAVMAGLEEVPPAPIHRDLKTDHIFLSDGRVILIDLDSVALGDPVIDPAHLYAHLSVRVGLDAMAPERARIVAAAFVDEYFAHVPKSWRQRFPFHCAGALIEVASGIFRRQEPQWPERVCATLAAARHALSGGLK